MIILVGLNSRINVYFIMLKEEELFSKILYLDILIAYLLYNMRPHIWADEDDGSWENLLRLSLRMWMFTILVFYFYM